MVHDWPIIIRDIDEQWNRFKDGAFVLSSIKGVEKTLATMEGLPNATDIGFE